MFLAWSSSDGRSNASGLDVCVDQVVPTCEHANGINDVVAFAETKRKHA